MGGGKSKSKRMGGVKKGRQKRGAAMVKCAPDVPMLRLELVPLRR